MAQDSFASQPRNFLDLASGTVIGKASIRVLLIEDSAADARLIEEFLKGTPLYQFHLTHVERLKEALQRLETTCYEVVLLDLTLPDSTGLISLEQLLRVAPSIPVLVLTNTDSPELAIEAVRQGAQDYLIKRQINHEVLVRSLRYAIERKQQAEALRHMNEALESRVQIRTQELQLANQQLREEIIRRQAVQERLQLAKKAGRIGIFEWDILTDYMAWSDELETLYGVSKQDFDGRCDSWLNMLCDESGPRVKEELWQAVTLGQGLDTEFKISHPNGARWLVVKSSVFNGDDGKPARMLGIHMDITDKKQLEEQFLQAQRLESLGALASGIAHDLNNILTPILGVGHLLPVMLPEMSEQVAQMIETFNCSAQRGTKLVQQIVAFARHSAGFHQTLSISELLSEIKKITAQTLSPSIEIKLTTSSDLWLVEGDDTRLHQVFMNLCVNARDAMTEGGLLRLEARNLLVDELHQQMHPGISLGPHVVITVTDTGIGMSPETLQKIFDPFFTTKPPSQGTGLGLAAVMGIVKSHGGLVEVQSTVGQGSRFSVYLPAKPDATKMQTTPLRMLSGQQELILVVDDEPAICKVIQMSLETYGYRVLIAQDAMEAIALLAEHRSEIACILIDIMMPNVAGTKAIPMLRRLSPEVPIVTMTGSITPFTKEDLSELPLHRNLAKPFTTRYLLALLQELLHLQ
ncbi:MAG: response regulator [Cyanobacteria bacterium P01_F01_bin.3]